ncbi:MAG: hypothetical protein EBZ59_06375, partial [Planctomycetia bacterium]|nr:hypothetical protein [Planctomycetia bacterium]
RARDAVVPVTWVPSIESLVATRDAIGGADRSGGIALSLEPVWLSSRQSLRRRLGDARSAIPSLEAVVLRGSAPLDHRAVLVEEGIRTICLDGFSDVARVSRRPAPRGWPCRTIVWGLWEVRGGPQPARGMVRSLLSWRSGPDPAPGSLAILHAGQAGEGVRATSARLERLIAWVERRRRSEPLHLAGLCDVPDLLAGAGQGPLAGSVLKAA